MLLVKKNIYCISKCDPVTIIYIYMRRRQNLLCGPSTFFDVIAFWGDPIAFHVFYDIDIMDMFCETCFLFISFHFLWFSFHLLPHILIESSWSLSIYILSFHIFSTASSLPTAVLCKSFEISYSNVLETVFEAEAFLFKVGVAGGKLDRSWRIMTMEDHLGTVSVWYFWTPSPRACRRGSRRPQFTVLYCCFEIDLPVYIFLSAPSMHHL